MTAKHCKPVAPRLEFGGLLSLALCVCGLMDTRVAAVESGQDPAGRQTANAGNCVIAGVCSDVDGKPLSGVRVVLYREDYEQWADEQLANLTTGDDGRFRFADLVQPPTARDREGWWYGLVMTKPGRASVVTFLQRDARDSLKFTLHPAATLQGRVTDVNGKPLAGVRVWARSLMTGPVEEASSTRTDAEGRYAITDMAAWSQAGTGCYFDVLHPNYGHERPSYGGIPATVDVTLQPAGIVEGRVFDRVTVRPAAGVWVTMQGTNREGPKGGGWGRTRTDATGKYRFQSLVAGKYNIWAEAPDRTCAALDSFAVEAGKQHTAPNLGLIEGGWIEGRVIDAGTGRPIGGGVNPGRLTVAIYGPSRPQSGPAVQAIEVDAAGRFRMRAAPGVNYPYIMQPDFNQRTENQKLSQEGVEVKAGEKTTVEFRIRPAAKP